ncbi:VPLPA-CTERM sorting domain-containing protein [Pacificoceanicola onchidii]|uniref:VPLPA-CTERM sorting domain-containing protein n=1 Tax=Pacificoceanicola onchidii TaxID=2562685 RepID=UPI0014561CD8|nr:VPLPA-CTERM sorting domain-containing protein [Pacificoceanicola onchidii]
MFSRAFAVGVVALLPTLSSAASIISDGNVSLGVDDFGQLNISGGVADVTGQTAVGVRYVDPTSGTEYEATSHGCLCEGWGLAVDGTTGSANNDFGGASGLTLVSFTSTATTAQSVVTVDGTNVQVTHDFQLSSSDNLYEVIVTVENTGMTAVTDLEYRRVMDWDTSPTPFDEYVTIGGTGTTTLLSSSSDDGFVSGNPLDAFGDLAGCGTTVDFVACGPDDHGAVFDFSLGGLGAGESYSFSIFYGGAVGLAEANAALGTVGAELYSFGWSGSDTNQDGYVDGTTDLAPTYIFAFSGVGGVVQQPNPTSPVPLPAGGVLLLTALAGFGALRRRKTQA